MSFLGRDLEKAEDGTAELTLTPSLRRATLEYERTNFPNLNPVSPYPTATFTGTNTRANTDTTTYFRDRAKADADSGANANNPDGVAGLRQRQRQQSDSNTLKPSTSTQTEHQHHPTFLHRLQTHHSQYLGTVGSVNCCEDESVRVLPFGAGKPYPPKLPGRELYVVEFEGKDDVLHGMNWPVGRKILTAGLLTYFTWIITFTSSIFSPAIFTISSTYSVNWIVGELGVSFFVLGFASGPLLWAPISELYGRRPPIVAASFLFSIFSIAVATAKDLQTVLICRFFSGFCGACGIAISPAVLADIFDNRTRGLAVTVFCATLFCGTLMGPFVGGFIVLNEGLGWRWTSYIPAILGFSAFAANLVFLKETYPPLILCAKAKLLRRKTLNWGIHAKQEEVEVDLKELVQKNFGRPLRMLFTEPIVFLISVYLSLLYGIVFVFLAAYANVFQKRHGMIMGVGGLPLLGILVGILLGAVFIVCLNPGYVRKLEKNGGVQVPEWRCPPAMLGGVCFTLGLFWFGWTGQYASVHWAVPTASGILTGFGIISIFLPMLNYLVDSYLIFAASAVAANTMMRSGLASACPMFSTYLFNRLGINWGMTLVGCFAACLIPIPFWFYFAGEKIRKGSKFAPTSA